MSVPLPVLSGIESARRLCITSLAFFVGRIINLWWACRALVYQRRGTYVNGMSAEQCELPYLIATIVADSSLKPGAPTIGEKNIMNVVSSMYTFLFVGLFGNSPVLTELREIWGPVHALQVLLVLLVTVLVPLGLCLGVSISYGHYLLSNVSPVRYRTSYLVPLEALIIQLLFRHPSRRRRTHISHMRRRTYLRLVREHARRPPTFLDIFLQDACFAMNCLLHLRALLVFAPFMQRTALSSL